MTGKLEGLWDPIPAFPGMVPVTKEDIGHMTKRVYQFDALVPVAEGQLVSVPPCKESFCRWLVCEAGNAASRWVERPLRVLPGRALSPLPGLATVSLPVTASVSFQPFAAAVSAAGGPAERLGGWDDHCRLCAVPNEAAEALHEELVNLGAVHIREITKEEWSTLKAWSCLRPLAQRRWLSHL